MNFSPPTPPSFGQADLLRQKNALEQVFKNSPNPAGMIKKPPKGGTALGLIIGWELGGALLENVFGQPQSLTSEEQEQQAIKNYGKDLSNSVNSKKIHQPPQYPFVGGQGNREYRVYYSGTYSNGGSFSGSTIADGPVVGLAKKVSGGSNWLYLDDASADNMVNSTGSLVVSHQTYKIDRITLHPEGTEDNTTFPPPTVPEISSPPNQPYLLPGTNSLSNGNPNNTKDSKPNGSVQASGLPTVKPKSTPPAKPLTEKENDDNKEAYPGRELGQSQNDKDAAFDQGLDYPLLPGWSPVNGSFDYPEIGKNGKAPETNRFVVHDPVLEAQKKSRRRLDPTNPNFTGEPEPEKTDNSQPLIPPVLLKNPKTNVTGTPTPTNDTGLKNPTDLLDPPEPEPKQTPVPTGLCADQCFIGLKDNVNQNSNKLDGVNAALNSGQIGADAAILAKLNAMDAWLIAKQVALWNYLVFLRVINLLTFAATIHNALMLSRDIGQTLGEALNNVLTIFGVKDADGITKGISETIGNTVENAVKGIIGAENYNSLTLTWKKLSSIYNSAANIAQLMSSSLSGIAEGIEITSKYTGKIGNALERSGTIIEGIAGKFGEAFSFKTGRLGRIQAALETGQEIASDIEEITAQALEATENVSQINTEITNIKNQIETEESTKETEKNTIKMASVTSNEISNADLVQPEVE